MFVNLLELLHFVYLIKYRFIKRQGGSQQGAALPGGREEVGVGDGISQLVIQPVRPSV